MDTSRAPVLRTTGLRRRFGSFRAVDGLDLLVEEGEVYGFLGRNGAGKTTTIRMLMGIIRADEGRMEVLGSEVRRIRAAQKRRIGYVSQEQFFYPWMNARALGRFVGSFYPTWDAAEYARLLEALDLPADRKVSALSHGMKVKLALALALAHRPELLILDEPTAGLDPVASREFLELVERQARDHGRATFFSSHRIDEVERIADRVGIIEKGRLLYQGTVEDLRASVRRLRPAPPAGTLPSPEFRLLREEEDGGERTAIVLAPAAAWEAAPFPGLEASPLPLEDIFIALVGGTTPRL